MPGLAIVGLVAGTLVATPARRDPRPRHPRIGAILFAIDASLAGAGKEQLMADHLDAPGLTSPAMDTRIDITDHYLFRKPGDQHRTVLVLNVNPLAPTHADEFRSGAVYETLIDTNDD